MAIDVLAEVPEDTFSLTPLGVVAFAMADGGDATTVMDALAEAAADMASVDSTPVLLLRDGRWLFSEV